MHRLVWPLVFLAIDIAAIVSATIFGARVLVRRPHHPGAQLIALIALDSACYVVLGRHDYSYWIAAPYRFEVGAWAAPLNFARNLTPGLFMMLCFTLFANGARFPRWLLALFAAEMLMEVLTYQEAAAGGELVPMILRAIPSALQTLFVGIALYWTVAEWSADLVEGRRRARVIVTILIGLNIVGSSLLLRVLIPQNAVANYDTHVTLVAADLLISIFLLVFSSDQDLREPLEAPKVRKPALPPSSVEVAGALARLNHLLDGEHVHRRPSLTVKELADLVGLPEYRLRKLIHEQLGYPNFNAFLHDYRIRDACLQLRDPQMRRTPILTIALSTGYQSINTFNRGFRDVMGMTPSAYRASEPEPAAEPRRRTSPKPA